MKKYKVKEIFGPTIQGEGSQTGRVVSFLRFAGCNRWSGKPEHKEKAACFFCDTDFVGGEELTSQDIVTRLKALGCEHVVISGGEPTLQLDRDLLLEMTQAGFKSHIETNGSKDISSYEDLITHISMSPKQDRSKTKLKRAHDVKVLYPYIGPGIDMDSFKDFPAMTFYLQPINDITEIDQKNLNKVIEHLVVTKSDFKLSLQLHKVLKVK